MKHDLDPLSQELLDAARGGHTPPPHVRDRVRTRVISRVGAAAFASSTLATAAWIKIAAPIAVLAIGTSAYFVAKRPPAQEQQPVIVAAPPPPIATTIETPALPPEPLVTATATTPPAHPIPPPNVTHVAAAPPPAVEIAPPSIKDETALLLNAQAAIREGDATRALSLLDDHAKRFPEGALAEERDASRVLALCAANRKDEARKEGQAFLATHPKSPAATRVRSSCAFSITDEKTPSH
jgi:hypothetical protein